MRAISAECRLGPTQKNPVLKKGLGKKEEESEEERKEEEILARKYGLFCLFDKAVSMLLGIVYRGK